MAVPTPREEELAAELAKIASERDQTTVKLEQALEEIKFLRAKLDALAQRLFGKKSEQLNESQMLLLLQESVAPGPAMGKGYGPETAQTPRSAKKPQRRNRSARVPEHLPVIEEVIVPEPVKAAPQDWRKIGEDVSEQLDFEPARFLRRRLVRPKYVLRKDLDAIPVFAPLPPTLQERCLATPSLIAHILVGKYCQHLPLYRQEAINWS